MFQRFMRKYIDFFFFFSFENERIHRLNIHRRIIEVSR